MKCFLSVLAIAVAGGASAHDLWLEKEDGGLGLYYGHKYSAHGGATFLEYQVEWVREALCFDAAGARISFQSEEIHPFRMRGECAAAHVAINAFALLRLQRTAAE